MLELTVNANNAELLADFLEHKLIRLIREGYTSGYNWDLNGEEEPVEE